MALIGSLVVSLVARTAEFERGLNRARQQVQTTASSIRGVSAGMAASFGAVSAAIGAIAANRGLQEIIRVGTAMEGTRAAFQAITGSAEAARAELAFVSQVSQTLATDLLTSTKAYQSIAAAARGTALEGKATRDIFLGVSQAARVLQLSGEEVSGVLNAVSQIMSKGTVSSEELRGQIGERLPGAFNIAARAIGVTTKELSDMLEQGRILSADFLPKFAAQLQKEFAGGVEKATQTAGAAFQRAANDITAMAAALADSGLLRWLANATEGFTKLAAEAVGASRTTRRALAEIQTQAPGASEASQRRFVELAEERQRATRRIQEIEDSIARSTIGGVYFGIDMKQRQQQIAAIKEQIREIDRLSAALLENQRQLEQTAARETIAEVPTQGVFDAEIANVRKRVDELRKAMDDIRRQGELGMPGLDVAAEQSKVLLKGLQDITEELAKQPGLVANLPKGIQDTLSAARLDVVKQTITDITARSNELRTSVRDWKDPLEQNRAELNFIEQQLDKLVDTFGVMREGQKVLDLTDAPETARQVQALIQRVQELRQGLLDVKEARKQDRAEEAAARREAEQAERFMESLRAEAKLRADALQIRDRESVASQRQIALMELEANIRERGITLSAEQRAEAEKLVQATATSIAALEAMPLRQEAMQAQAEAQRNLLTSMAQEINLRGQLLDIQRLSDTERDIAAQALTMEAELTANGVTITEHLRAGIRQLAAEYVRLGGAIEAVNESRAIEQRFQQSRTETFTDLARELNHLTALVDIQRKNRVERERELIVLQTKRQLVGQVSAEEEAALRQFATEMQRLNTDLQRRHPLRDFFESTEDFWVNMEDIGVEAIQGLGDALEEFAKTGKFSVKDMIDDIIGQLARLAAATLASEAFRLFQPKEGGTPSTATTWLNTALSLAATALGSRTNSAATPSSSGTPSGYGDATLIPHRGGIIGRDTFPRIALPSAVFTHAQRFAMGGLIMSRGGDNVPALLQTGERVLNRQETSRLAQLEQAIQLARQVRQEQMEPQQGHTFNLVFPNVATRQDADALRRSASQVQNQIITAVERSRARNNIPSSTR
jgi:tape measure domain-containing protein